MGGHREPSAFCCGACEHVELAAHGEASYAPSPPVVVGTGGALLTIFSSGEEHPMSVEPGTRLTIGRGASCGIRLDDPMVDRTASEFEITATGEVYISDLGSSCGTIVNDTRVGRRRVHEQDVIRLGNSTLTFDRGG